jgi:hypothetical protein
LETINKTSVKPNPKKAQQAGKDVVNAVKETDWLSLDSYMQQGSKIFDALKSVVNPTASVQQQQRQPVQYQYSDRGTMIDQFGYQPGQLTPELQSQIDQYKRALNRVESIYNKPMANIGGEDYNKMPYGMTGGMNYTPNQYLRESLRSEQEASARVTPKMADGGLMNLRMGGMPAEMDLRAKGGFVPIGRKERADDVPARLSKNEFVFTAKAVRNAGGGDVRKGAKRMYQIMNQLEARS